MKLWLVVLLLAWAAGPAVTLLVATPAAAQSDDDRDEDGGDDADDGGDDADDGPGEEDRDDDRAPGRNPAQAENDGGFFQRLFGTRDHMDRQLVGWALTEAQRAALAGAGFAAIEVEALPALGVSVTRLSAPPGRSAPAALAEARSLVPGAVLDLNHLYAPDGAVCRSSECWAAQMVGLEPALPASCRLRPPIGVIDAMPDTVHPALRRTPIETRSFVPEGYRPAAIAHGTAVTALIAGEIVQSGDARPLVPNAKIVAAGVMFSVDRTSRTDAVAVIRALDWVIARGVRVVAVSLSGPENAALERAVAAAARRVAIAAAAGNGGPNGPAAYPAAWPGVLAVAAVDRTGRPYRNGTRGDYIDVAAPGVAVLSAAADGRIQPWTGTSFAVPWAAAALSRAMVATRNDPQAAIRMVTRLARDLGPRGIDPIFGAGLLQMPSTCR